MQSCPTKSRKSCISLAENWIKCARGSGGGPEPAGPPLVESSKSPGRALRDGHRRGATAPGRGLWRGFGLEGRPSSESEVLKVAPHPSRKRRDGRATLPAGAFTSFRELEGEEERGRGEGEGVRGRESRERKMGRRREGVWGGARGRKREGEESKGGYKSDCLHKPHADRHRHDTLGNIRSTFRFRPRSKRMSP